MVQETDETAAMLIEKSICFKIQYDPECDSGYIIVGDSATGNISRSEQDCHVGAGPIVLDFDNSNRLLRIEVNEFSKLMPPAIMQQLKQNL